MRIGIIAALFALLASAARADVPPRPGQVEAYLAETVRAAGNACADPATIERAGVREAAVMEARGLQARVLRCAGGQRFLVGTPPRRYGPPRPDQPALAPAVQRLD